MASGIALRRFPSQFNNIAAEISRPSDSPSSIQGYKTSFVRSVGGGKHTRVSGAEWLSRQDLEGLDGGGRRERRFGGNMIELAALNTAFTRVSSLFDALSGGDKGAKPFPRWDATWSHVTTELCLV